MHIFYHIYHMYTCLCHVHIFITCIHVYMIKYMHVYMSHIHMYATYTYTHMYKFQMFSA